MIGGKPPNPHFNSLFLNQSDIKIVVWDSAVLPTFLIHPFVFLVMPSFARSLCLMYTCA